ncbi:MAG TPA: hypothetical protein VJN70_09170, partial [Gemmatimonadaceae bacterium]|nr:hypothetical protein [Gemmatimonadaceae bacterium]
MRRPQPYREASERLFGALLLLYPRSFRARFEDEMLAFFRERRNEARYRLGLRGTVRLWRHLSIDIALSAPIEHFRALFVRTASEAPPIDVPWSSPFYLEQEHSMDAFLQDLRFAIRTLRARP